MTPASTAIQADRRPVARRVGPLPEVDIGNRLCGKDDGGHDREPSGDHGTPGIEPGSGVHTGILLATNE